MLAHDRWIHDPFIHSPTMVETGEAPSIQDIVASMDKGETDKTIHMVRAFSKEADDDGKRELLNAMARRYEESTRHSVDNGCYTGGRYREVLAVKLPDSDVVFRNAVRSCFDHTIELCSDPGRVREDLMDSLFGLALDYMAIPTAAGAVRNLLEKALKAIDSMGPYEPRVEVDWSPWENDLVYSCDRETGIVTAMRRIVSGIASRTGACSMKEVSKRSRRLNGKRKEIRETLDKLSISVDFGFYDSIEVTAEMYIDLIAPSKGDAGRGGKRRSKHRKNRHRTQYRRSAHGVTHGEQRA